MEVKNGVVRFEHVNFRYPGAEEDVLHDIDFVAESGKTTAIIGSTGCRKSTLVNLIPRLYDVTGGSITLDGKDIRRITMKDLRDEIGFVPQNTVAYLHPLIKIKNQLTDGYHIHFQTSKKAAQERAKTLLDRVGIRDVNRVMESYPAQISGGMRQRVNIAMALMCEPQVIIADEPTTALDCVVKQQVIELFHSINEQQHVAIIMISHDLNLIRRYCDKVAVMYAGQIVESGGSNEVFSQPQHPYTQALLSVIPRLDQDRNVRLNEIPGYVPEHGRDTSHCLFQPRCSACRQECGGSVKSSRRDGHFVRCSKAWEECRA